MNATMQKDFVGTGWQRKMNERRAETREAYMFQSSKNNTKLPQYFWSN
jgi:hypothetical protein